MQYKEVHSLEESLAILDKYKNKITQEQFMIIKSAIHNFAHESMYANEKDIVDAIKIVKGIATADELVAEVKQEWKLQQ